MDFNTTWNTCNIGDIIKISNNTPPPTTKKEGIHYMSWYSHNFTGKLVEKIEGDWRSMSFELPPMENGSVIGYIIIDDSTHSFELL